MIYFSTVSLGCSKNLVDTQLLIGKIFEQEGKKVEYILDPEDERVEYVLINTCGFLESARKEAEDNIKYFDKLGKKLIITGCYLTVKNNTFLKKLKNLHKILYWDNEIKDILKSEDYEVLKLKFKRKKLDFSDKQSILLPKGSRFLTNQILSYEYVKIAEGCNNNCTFCIIPKIRGKQTSKSMEEILEELEYFTSIGIMEIQIIAQDTSQYGIDLYGESKLIELLQKIDKIDKDFKVRVHYLNPSFLTEENLLKFKNLKKFIPYFDIPFQHISDEILKKMGRNYKKNDIINIVNLIRDNFKNSFIHTNIIVGFPGETSEIFDELLNFLKKYYFDDISVFSYEDEEMAASYKLNKKVINTISEMRKIQINKLKFENYVTRMKKLKGKILNGYIEGGENGIYMIRNEDCAPEIYFNDYVREENIDSLNLNLGSYVKYKIDADFTIGINEQLFDVF